MRKVGKTRCYELSFGRLSKENIVFTASKCVLRWGSRLADAQKLSYNVTGADNNVRIHFISAADIADWRKCSNFLERGEHGVVPARRFLSVFPAHSKRKAY